MKKVLLILTTLLLLGMMPTLSAEPVGPFGFVRITDNNSVDLADQFQFFIYIDGDAAVFTTLTTSRRRVSSVHVAHLLKMPGFTGFSHIWHASCLNSQAGQ